MWKVLIFLNIGILHYTVFSTLPSPINVIFSSVNLRNVLQWSPGNGTPSETYYTVQYALYGDSVPGSKGKSIRWKSVRLCTEIVRNWCDLSNETWDLEQGYLAKVRAVGRKETSKWAMTETRFDPKIETDFGPPLVSVEIEDNTAIITMRGPMRYLPNNQTPAVSMATIFPQMTYNLSVLNAHSHQIRHISVVSNKYTYHRLDYGTEYCFSASTRFLVMPVRCLPSAWHCIFTPEDPVITQLKRIVVGIIVPALCICFLVVGGYVLHHYLMGRDQKSPYILNPPSFHPAPLTLLPDKLNTILITAIVDELPFDTKGHKLQPASIRELPHNLYPPLSYDCQNPETPTPPEEEQWNESAVEYGHIGVNPLVCFGRDEENMGSSSEGGVSGTRLNETDAGTLTDNQQEQEAKEACTRFTALRSDLFFSHMSSHAELSTLAQAHAWRPMNPSLLRRTHESLSTFQGADRGATYQERETHPGLFLSRNPETGLLDLALNLQTSAEGSMGEEVKGQAMGRKTDGHKEDGSESEKVALLCGYASQNVRAALEPDFDQLQLLPCDYGLISAETQETEAERSLSIKWDPESHLRLMFPEVILRDETGSGYLEPKMEMTFREEGEEVNRDLKLENVYIRQQSEEEAGGQVATEIGEAGDMFSKWKLVVSMD